MAEVANVVEETVKPAARRVVRRVKAAAKKPAARKPAARKTASRAAAQKPATRKAKPAASLKKATEAAKEVAYAQLGVYGKVYDTLNERVSKARKQAPKKWNELVRRGERVQHELDKAQKDLTKDLRKRVNAIEIPAPIEDGVTRFRKAVKKLTDRVNRKAA